MSPFARFQDLILPIGIIASILVIMVPLPPVLMDLLLAANITVAVIVLLTTVFVRTPLEFSVFPTLLLVTTLARLVLNVATTRLILTQAQTDGLRAAGGVIQSFGDFVAGNNIVVGLIIFIILVAIQFLVITKGATRISEVAARFALDGMPGRQMAIDADLNAGLIDEKEALRRREEITQQADFHGAMDGASKFVRGDAIVGIVITLINIIGGLVVGVVQANMSLVQAGELFTKLTIGDGLASQIPAFLISLSAGLLVTRSTRRTNLPSEFNRQLFTHPQALAVAAGFLGLLVFTNLPSLPLLMLGGGCLGLSLMIAQGNRTELASQQAREEEHRRTTAQNKERIEDYLAVDPMELEIGVRLIRLADPKRGGDLLPRITGVRQSVATEIGIVLPKVRIRDNMRLDDNGYCIKIANNPVADGKVLPERLLAVDSGHCIGTVDGVETQDPASGRPAVWIDPTARERAEAWRYTCVEPTAVLVGHLREVVYRHADELLTRDATKHLIDELRKTSPAVVNELIPDAMKLGEVQTVLRMLLRERVPIRQLGMILETLGDYVSKTTDAIWLAEQVRSRLARTLCTQYRDAEQRLHVVTLDPSLEDRVANGIDHEDRGFAIRIPPQAVNAICHRIAESLEPLKSRGLPEIVLVGPRIRPGLRQLTASALPRLVVLSYNEITQDTKTESVGIVTDSVTK